MKGLSLCLLLRFAFAPSSTAGANDDLEGVEISRSALCEFNPFEPFGVRYRNFSFLYPNTKYCVDALLLETTNTLSHIYNGMILSTYFGHRFHPKSRINGDVIVSYLYSYDLPFF